MLSVEAQASSSHHLLAPELTHINWRAPSEAARIESISTGGSSIDVAQAATIQNKFNHPEPAKAMVFSSHVE